MQLFADLVGRVGVCEHLLGAVGHVGERPVDVAGVFGAERLLRRFGH